MGQKGRGILSQNVEAGEGFSTIWDKIPRPFCPRLAGVVGGDVAGGEHGVGLDVLVAVGHVLGGV